MAQSETLHDHAVQAYDHTEQLATGLAAAKAPEAVLGAVRNVSATLKKIVSVLGAPEDPDDVEDTEPVPDEEGPAERETMDSAANSLVADIRGARN